jgi:acyl-CoA hydrolase
VEVIAENPITGEQTQTNSAYSVYVALNEEGDPQPVPALISETQVEKQRLKAGKKRQEFRLAQGKKSRPEK